MLSLEDAKRMLANPVDKFNMDNQAMRVMLGDLVMRVESLEIRLEQQKLCEKKGKKK